MPNKDTSADGQRIAKVIARAGLASRREAEAWIAAGRVAVNGSVISSPALDVGAKDRITVDGAPLPARERTRLFLYHKPRGLVTSHGDPQGRPTIFAALPKGLPRLVSVGRLDLNTEGLLLLTNDGGLARVLELPETGWLRRYRVRAHGSVDPAALAGLRTGISIDGIRYGAIEAAVDRQQGSNVWITFAMREGKNREVKNVLGHLGLRVNRLIRVSFGPFQLGELAEGAVEEVKTRVLRDQLGERIVAQAGADFAGPIVAVAVAPQPLPRRPEVRAKRASTGDGPGRTPTRPAAPASPPRKRGRDENGKRGKDQKSEPAEAKSGKRGPVKAGKRANDLDRLGGPEMARRERKGRRPYHGKRER